MDFIDARYPIQVKQKDKNGRPDTEIQSSFRKIGKSTIAAAVKDMLEE